MVRPIITFGACLILTACAGGSLKPTVPGQSDGRKACPTTEGTIIDIIDVTIEGPTEIAQGTGAAFGAYVGNRAAKDESDVVEALATGIGAVAGSMAGDAASKTVMSRAGVELMVYVGGTTHSIVQETDARQPYGVGDDVWVVGNLNPVTQSRYSNTQSSCKSGIRVLIKR
jgi:outer membrane lipoprotein SlyB